MPIYLRIRVVRVGSESFVERLRLRSSAAARMVMIADSINSLLWALVMLVIIMYAPGMNPEV